MNENKKNQKTNTNTEKRKRGGQLDNKNAVGNRGGKGAAFGNNYALKHGKYTAAKLEKAAQLRAYLKHEREISRVLEARRKAIWKEYKAQRNAIIES